MNDYLVIVIEERKPLKKEGNTYRWKGNFLVVLVMQAKAQLAF